MVDEGFLTDEQLSHALAEQGQTGQPLGKVLVDLGYVSPGAVANALAEQHGGLLKTEYGTSAGLLERAPRSPIRADAAQPAPPAPTPAPVAPEAPAPAAPLGSGLRLAQPVATEPAAATAAAPPEPQPEPPAPEAEVSSSAAGASNARIEELESQLHGALTERNSLAQSFNELQVRLNEAAQGHEAGVSAEVAERVGALENRLQVAMASREELERAQQLSASRIAELEAQLQSTSAERSEVEELSSTQNAELNRELEELRTAAAEREGRLERMVGLEAELEQLRARDDSGDGHQAAEIKALRVQLQEVAEKRDAAEARASALENDLTPLRSELESLREQAAGTTGLAARVSELSEALHAASAERDAAVERVAALKPELASLRDRVNTVAAERDAALAGRAGTDPEAGALREQLAARERRLAESVGEIAKMNGEHRALLQLVERQFQLEESTTAVPETKGEAAHVLFVPTVTGYTLVEQDGAAPEAGDVVELDAGRFVVRRLGPSPLPGPRRRCAYLERV